MFIRIWRGILVMSLVMGQALALEIPLIVEETTGIERVGNAVNSGVTLPRGAVKDVAELRLLDAQGKVFLPPLSHVRGGWVMSHLSGLLFTSSPICRRTANEHSPW